MKKEIIETKAHRCWMRDDGLTHTQCKEHSVIDAQGARESMSAISKVNSGQKGYLVVDSTKIKGMSREARIIYSGPEAAAVCHAIAIIIGSPVSRVIGNFFMGINKHPFPSKLFTNEQEAVNWLTEFRDEHQSK